MFLGVAIFSCLTRSRTPINGLFFLLIALSCFLFALSLCVVFCLSLSRILIPVVYIPPICLPPAFVLVYPCIAVCCLPNSRYSPVSFRKGCFFPFPSTISLVLISWLNFKIVFLDSIFLSYPIPLILLKTFCPFPSHVTTIYSKSFLVNSLSRFSLHLAISHSSPRPQRRYTCSFFR